MADSPNWHRASYILRWLAFFAVLGAFLWRPADFVALLQALASVLFAIALLFLVSRPGAAAAMLRALHAYFVKKSLESTEFIAALIQESDQYAEQEHLVPPGEDERAESVEVRE